MAFTDVPEPVSYSAHKSSLTSATRGPSLESVLVHELAVHLMTGPPATAHRLANQQQLELICSNCRATETCEEVEYARALSVSEAKEETMRP